MRVPYWNADNNNNTNTNNENGPKDADSSAIVYRPIKNSSTTATRYSSGSLLADFVQQQQQQLIQPGREREREGKV